MVNGKWVVGETVYSIHKDSRQGYAHGEPNEVEKITTHSAFFFYSPLINEWENKVEHANIKD